MVNDVNGEKLSVNDHVKIVYKNEDGSLATSHDGEVMKTPPAIVTEIENVLNVKWLGKMKTYSFELDDNGQIMESYNVMPIKMTGKEVKEEINGENWHPFGKDEPAFGR